MNRDDGHPYLRTFTAGPSAAGPERSAIGPLLPPGGGTDRDRGAVEGTCRAVCLPRESGVFRPAGRFCRLREKDRMGVRARGFTLIELMVVMVLIALLLTIAVPRYFSTIDNGRQSVQRQNISAIRDAIDKYYGDQGKYPQTLQDLVDKKYLRSVPIDPVTELPNWVIVPPTDPNLTGVYDIRSAKAPEGANGASGS
jgi:general secretion pathway protein G